MASKRSPEDKSAPKGKEKSKPKKGAAASKATRPKGPKGQRPKRTRKRPTGLGQVDDTLLSVLSHALRIRMLVSLNEEGDGSASDLAERLNCQLSDTSYHIKVLLKYEYVEFVELEYVGSAAKKIYRAIRKAEFPQEVWEQLPPYIQNTVVAGLFMTAYGDAQTALLSGAYEKRPESHASWTNMELDEKTWLQSVKLLDDTFKKVLKLQKDSEEKVKKAKAAGEEMLTVSLTMSAFVLPDDDDGTSKKKANVLKHGNKP